MRGTPVEIAESQTPLIFWKKELRPGSGGVGRTQGGHGQVIEIGSGVDRPWDILAAFDRIDHPARAPFADEISKIEAFHLRLAWVAGREKPGADAAQLK